MQVLETLSQKTIKSLKEDVEDCKDDISTVYMEAKPMFNGINQLHHEAEATGRFNEGVHNNYMSYLKGGSIGSEIQELQNITNLSNPKAKESEQGMLSEEEDNQIAKNSKKKNLPRRH